MTDGSSLGVAGIKQQGPGPIHDNLDASWQSSGEVENGAAGHKVVSGMQALDVGTPVHGPESDHPGKAWWPAVDHWRSKTLPEVQIKPPVTISLERATNIAMSLPGLVLQCRIAESGALRVHDVNTYVSVVYEENFQSSLCRRTYPEFIRILGCDDLKAVAR
jgi:hypothetical protein